MSLPVIVSSYGIHSGIACDGCGVNPIVGLRFRCRDCQNYDLCGQCISAVAHNNLHQFEIVNILSPLPPMPVE